MLAVNKKLTLDVDTQVLSTLVVELTLQKFKNTGQT
jgi:hypothetical protein